MFCKICKMNKELQKAVYLVHFQLQGLSLFAGHWGTPPPPRTFLLQHPVLWWSSAWTPVSAACTVPGLVSWPLCQGAVPQQVL